MAPATRMLAMATVLLLVSGAGADEKTDKELQVLEGEYQVTRVEMAGATPPTKGLTVTIQKGVMVMAKDGRTLAKDTIKTLDPTKKIKEMDLLGLEGLNKNKTVKAIYELKGDTLSLCIAEDDKAARPTAFKGTKDYTLMVCERAKAKK